MRRLLDWPNDRRAFGPSWDGPAGAHAAAIGEAVERYCGNWPGPHTRIVATTYDALARPAKPLCIPASSRCTPLGSTRPAGSPSPRSAATAKPRGCSAGR
ncbi:hypothetical protein [Amycolatopsis sp. NPDC051061]|uniref:hypothetical protein n=1 Tax=Amycolatopsis sp. NPDC051061 TaxID=3155042 RepID=UPI00342F3174